MARKRNPVRDQTIKSAYLKALEGGSLVCEACEAAGVSKMRIHNMRKADPLFNLDHEIALAVGATVLVKEATRRAVDGVRKHLYHQGRPLWRENPETGELEHAYEIVYSDALLIRLLEARDPDTFDGRVRIAKRLRRWQREDAEGKQGETTPLEDALKALEALATAKALTA